jgi:hypothetical protein
MGYTPATGQEISIGCVYTAFGLTPIPGANIGLNSTLGVNRQPPQAQGVTAIALSAATTLSVDMGGLDTPQNYCNSLVLFTRTAINEGYTTSTAACTGTTTFNIPVYFSTATADWLAANGKTVYTNSQLTTVFNGGSQHYKSDGTNTSVYSPQINSSGVVIGVTSCPL